MEIPKSHIMSVINSVWSAIFSERTVVVIPKTPAMLKKFEPMMFPTERSASFLKAAIMIAA